MSRVASLGRLTMSVFLGAAAVILACIPMVLLMEQFGWSQRPVHLVQSFLAVPTAFVSSGVFLFLPTLPGAPVWHRRAAWTVFLLSGAWLALLIAIWAALSAGMFPEPA